MRRLALAVLVALAPALALAQAQNESRDFRITASFGTAANPNTTPPAGFGRNDVSHYCQTSDGTAEGAVTACWVYSKAAQRWVALPQGSGGAGAVSSVFGRTGAVTAQASDYASSYYPLGANPAGYLTAETPQTLSVAGQNLSISNGNTVVLPSPPACTCGEVREFAAAPPAPWVWANAGGSWTCASTGQAFTLPDRRNRVVVAADTQAGAGTLSAATALTQANLPSLTLSATTQAGGNIETSFEGVFIRGGNVNQGNTVVYGGGWNWLGGSGPDRFGYGRAAWILPSHTHTVSVPLGGSNTPLTTANLPRLNVNYFVCVD